MADGKQLGAAGSALENQAVERRHRARPLTSWMEDQPRPLAELLPVMVSVLEAIAKLNATEEHFCNLDPGKILIRENGSVQVSTQNPFESGKTFNLGSAKYTCPESFRDAAPGTPAGSNAYIAGFVFYELLLGRTLFEAQFKDVNHSAYLGWITWHADASKRAASLSQMNRYPAFVCRVVDQMIEKNPAKRLMDINGIARLFGSVSNATMVYKVVRDPSSASDAAMTVAKPDNELRGWLVNLGKQKLWKSLWKHVAPNEPHLRQSSIEELERMFRDAEGKLKKIGSIFSSKEPGRRRAGG
jgi:hypothetical protein